MIKYNVKLNNGVEALNINEKSVSAEEVVENVDAKFMAHHMHLPDAHAHRPDPRQPGRQRRQRRRQRRDELIGN